jgi:hypothetical protein
MSQAGCPEFEPQTSGNKKKSLEDCAIDLWRDLYFLNVSTYINATVSILLSSSVLSEIGRLYWVLFFTRLSIGNLHAHTLFHECCVCCDSLVFNISILYLSNTH